MYFIYIPKDTILDNRQTFQATYPGIYLTIGNRPYIQKGYYYHAYYNIILYLMNRCMLRHVKQNNIMEFHKYLVISKVSGDASPLSYAELILCIFVIGIVEAR